MCFFFICRYFWNGCGWVGARWKRIRRPTKSQINHVNAIINKKKKRLVVVMFVFVYYYLLLMMLYLCIYDAYIIGLRDHFKLSIARKMNFTFICIRTHQRLTLKTRPHYTINTCAHVLFYNLIEECGANSWACRSISRTISRIDLPIWLHK